MLGASIGSAAGRLVFLGGRISAGAASSDSSIAGVLRQDLVERRGGNGAPEPAIQRRGIPRVEDPLACGLPHLDAARREDRQESLGAAFSTSFSTSCGMSFSKTFSARNA
jgi:hypothetical protein